MHYKIQVKMSEKFCLKWNDFHSNVSKSFELFRNEDYLHDVTLVSDDHKQVSAHKLVLSACSEYFKDIFKLNIRPNSHPLVCLDGIKSDDLKNIMDYIYNGEVQIFQENLDRFLVVAQRLKLEGLMGNDDSQPQQEDFVASEEKVHGKFNVEAPPVSHVAEKVLKTHKSKELATVEKIVASVSSEDVSEARKTVQQYIETGGDGKSKCSICGKEAVGKDPAQAKWNLENHIETHLEGLSFPCQLCGKTFRSRKILTNHKARQHK